MPSFATFTTVGSRFEGRRVAERSSLARVELTLS
jgi:hypothetical protein